MDGITLENLRNNIDANLAKQKFNIGNAMFNKIQKAIINLDNDRNKYFEHGYPNYIFETIKKQYKSNNFTFYELKKYLNENTKYNVSFLTDDINELVTAKRISYDGDNYCIYVPSLMDEINKKIKTEHKNILLEKLKGRTLESIGQELGVTRERVRQIISKSLDLLQNVQEDKYKDLYEKYLFTCDVFCDVFNEEKEIYYYLKEKYNAGDNEISELLETDILNQNQKTILRSKYNIINYSGENIIVTKTNLLVTILKYSDKKIDIEDLIVKYNEIIEKYNLFSILDCLDENDFRNIDAILSRNMNVICSFKKYFRFYDLSDLSEFDITRLKKLLDTESGAYSVELFFNDNSLLMKELDIRDEYELHNIFRKVCTDNHNIIFNRMPDILIDCNDKLKFIENKIIELTPISIDDFANFMYENYGHKPTTLKALVSSKFYQYIDNDMLVTNSPVFTEEQELKMKEILTKDIYSIITIKQLLTDLFDVNDFRLINNINLTKLGYKVRGNYIMKSSIISLENYLKEKVLAVDYYIPDEEMKKIGSTFSSYLYKMIYEKILFRVSDDKYITIRKLNQLGISKEDIEKFQFDVSNVIKDNEYFNLYYIKEKISFGKLIKEELSSDFFETLIMIIPSIKSLRIENNKVFIKTDDSPTRQKFISHIIEKYDKIQVSEIKRILKEIYNIDLFEYDIRTFINKNKYYYHEGTDCVYLNRNIYEEEVKQWDILQYLN